MKTKRYFLGTSILLALTTIGYFAINSPKLQFSTPSNTNTVSENILHETEIVKIIKKTDKIYILNKSENLLAYTVFPTDMLERIEWGPCTDIDDCKKDGVTVLKKGTSSSFSAKSQASNTNSISMFWWNLLYDSEKDRHYPEEVFSIDVSL